MEIYDIIARSARSWPDRPAVIDKYGRLDYQTLYKQVNILRDKLLTLGVQPQQAIGVMGANSRSFILCAFAALGCGATVFPISPKLKKTELAFLIETAGLNAVLCDVELAPLAADSSTRVAIDAITGMELVQTGNSRKPHFRKLVPDAAFVRFTSGTTNESKGVILSHKIVLERIEAANKGLNLSHDDVVLWVLPMAFHFFVSIVLYLRYGVAIVVCPDHFADTLLEWANTYKATFLYAAPLHYRLLAANDSDTQFETLRRAVSTSTSLPVQTAQAFRQRYHIPISQAYGIIEVGLPLLNLDQTVERPASVGKALPDYDVAVLDDSLAPVADGSVGQLAIKGPGMFDAYLHPFLWRCDVTRNGWFLTGDLAVRDKDGFITIVGRSKALINVGGNKVFPEEVEAVIDQYPLVEISKVSAKLHPQLGEVVHADIVCRSRSRTIDTEELLTFCRTRLASFKVPQSVSFVEKVERTASGKITRR